VVVTKTKRIFTERIYPNPDGVNDCFGIRSWGSDIAGFCHLQSLGSESLRLKTLLIAGMVHFRGRNSNRADLFTSLRPVLSVEIFYVRAINADPLTNRKIQAFLFHRQLVTQETV
jgi:hypothetical protein